jgi:hypothetical protein
MKLSFSTIGCIVLAIIVAITIVLQELRIRDLESQTAYLKSRLATVEKDAARQEKELSEKIKESGKEQMEWIIRHMPFVDGPAKTQPK